MKYFSLDFIVDKKDYQAYYRDFGKGLIFNQLKKSVPTIIFIIVMLMLNAGSEMASLFVVLAFVFIVSVIMPLSYSKKLSLSLLESRNSRKLNRYDFFADHIEIHVSANEKSEASAEKHLMMNGFTSVAESSVNFYFSYMNEKMLIIPKRVLDGEKYAMIKNLIDNYFSDVYMTV